MTFVAAPTIRGCCPLQRLSVSWHYMDIAAGKSSKSQGRFRVGSDVPLFVVSKSPKKAISILGRTPALVHLPNEEAAQNTMRLGAN